LPAAFRPFSSLITDHSSLRFKGAEGGPARLEATTGEVFLPAAFRPFSPLIADHSSLLFKGADGGGGTTTGEGFLPAALRTFSSLITDHSSLLFKGSMHSRHNFPHLEFTRARVGRAGLSHNSAAFLFNRVAAASPLLAAASSGSKKPTVV
jgi:hypothetical protein